MNRNDRARYPVSRLLISCLLSFVTIAAAPAWAHTAGELYKQGNAAFDDDNCVRAAARYYALQVRYPESVNKQIGAVLDERIAWCESHSKIASSVKADGTGTEAPKKPTAIPPPMVGVAVADRCSLYANLAVTQYRINQVDKCGFQDSRWNDDFTGHKTWCKGVSNHALDVENTARQKALTQCHQ